MRLPGRGSSGTGQWRAVRRWPLLVLAGAALLLGLWLLRTPLLVGVARLVTVEDELRPADLIFLLSGDGFEGARAHRAAQLYRDGFAPRVVVARSDDTPSVRMGLYPNDTDVNLRVLQRLGVPRESIRVLVVPGGVTSTTDEARALRGYLSRHPARRVIVVTSDYHTARARWNLRRELEGAPVEIRMAAATDPEVNASNWWRSERGLLRYASEYLKFAHNWIFR